MLLLITAAVAYLATSLTCSLSISNDSNYSSLCGQSLSAFSYYPQATSSAVSYSSIKIRNWVLFLSPVPSPCSLQQAVNTSNSQTAKIETQDTYPPYRARRHCKITPYSTLSLCETFFPSKLSLPPFFLPTSKPSAVTVLNTDVNTSLFHLAGIHVNLRIFWKSCFSFIVWHYSGVWFGKINNSFDVSILFMPFCLFPKLLCQFPSFSMSHWLLLSLSFPCATQWVTLSPKDNLLL